MILSQPALTKTIAEAYSQWPPASGDDLDITKNGLYLLMAEINAHCAKIFGLDVEEFDFILENFTNPNVKELKTLSRSEFFSLIS